MNSNSEKSALWSKSTGVGVPVVMIHGAFCDYRYWSPQQASYGRQYRAISVSLRGYYPDNRLAADETLSAERHVAQVCNFLRTLSEPVHLIGHSRGGRIALHVAARQPDLVRTLVLAEPGGTLAGDFPPAKNATGIAGGDVRDRTQALIEGHDPEAGLRLYVDSGHGAGAWDRSPHVFRKVAIENARTIVWMSGDVSAALSRDVASQISSPTLLVAGDSSPPLFGHILDVLQGCIKSASRATIADANHFLTLARPQEFDREVVRFWSVVTS